MKTLIRLELRRTNFRTYYCCNNVRLSIPFRICPYVRDK